MSAKTNIETIQKQIVEDTFIKDTEIYDGISLECKIPEGKTYKQCETALNKECKKLDLLPISMEPREDSKLFLLQFPELEPYYNEEQLYYMFYKSLDYLVSTNITLTIKAGYKVTRTMLIDSTDKYVFEVLRLYYNSNVNKYKTTLDDLKNDTALHNKIKDIFLEVITKYV